MTAQETLPPSRPHGVDAAAEEDLQRQKAIFEEREEELLEKYPGKNIGICGGEVFVGDSLDEVTDRAEEVYPDRLIYFYGPPVLCMVS
ncbi:MAG: hypothetical protein OXU37_08570 [Thaumarchaeota archaeon]|nr:hypothetical protein [Nitrososphaerota archaeon]RNJ73056.1 MAG: hypothetical protein EB833_03480 [Thaumarchaeota archaeon S13]RNJ74922.1 MAG: hypothetical protein EB824_02575 [Thaumarchaeota archaeon S15]